MARHGSKNHKKTHTQKSKTNKPENTDPASKTLRSEEHLLRIPRSLVIRRGKAQPELITLVSNLRTLFSPHTALSFQENARNRKATISHYAKHICNPMGITHLITLSQNECRLPMKFTLLPDGPTLSFQIRRFSLMSHVQNLQKRPYHCPKLYQKAPIVVTNNFGDHTAPSHVKLLRICFQGMFPKINIATVKLMDCQRVVMFNYIRRNVKDDTSRNSKDNVDNGRYDNEDEQVEVRHYAIRATPIGVRKKVRRLLLSSKKIPNLSKFNNMEEYMLGDGDVTDVSEHESDTEPEDNSTTHNSSTVILPQTYKGTGNATSQKSSLKLIELGPRLRVKLMKVEKGLGTGEVLYHAYVKKTDEEVKGMKQKIDESGALKIQRREEQAQNVERKRKAKQEHLNELKKKKEEKDQFKMLELKSET